MGAAAIPIVTALIAAGGSYMAAKASQPDMPEPVTELEKPEQPVEDVSRAKEEEMLAEKEKKKRMKKGYLDSFGDLDVAGSQALI